MILSRIARVSKNWIQNGLDRALAGTAQNQQPAKALTEIAGCGAIHYRINSPNPKPAKTTGTNSLNFTP
eukprot:1655770-Amphidinium_carterae.1